MIYLCVSLKNYSKITTSEAIQVLKNSVTSRGGNPGEYSFSVHTRYSDAYHPIDNSRSKSVAFDFFIQRPGGGGIIAHGTSWATVCEKLDEFFGIAKEPIESQIPDIEITKESMLAPDGETK